MIDTKEVVVVVSSPIYPDGKEWKIKGKNLVAHNKPEGDLVITDNKTVVAVFHEWQHWRST